MIPNVRMLESIDSVQFYVEKGLARFLKAAQILEVADICDTILVLRLATLAHQ